MTAFVLALAVAGGAPVPQDRKADEEFARKVAAARERAVKYLREKQDGDGGWESGMLAALPGMDGGVTALAALSLLEAGVLANDPAVAKAVGYLLPLKPDKTYTVSLRTQVLARADAKKYAKEVQAGADWLLKHALFKGGKLLGWSYPGNELADNSNTHFAVMGLHAAAQAGATVDVGIWRRVRDLYADTQHKSGGWVYHNSGAEPNQNMTAAGLLGLAVAVKYDKGAKGPDPAFERGMQALLGGEFKETGKSVTYSWLTTAELGRALGSTEFKSGKFAKAWYREGAEKLAKEQQPDGSWKPDGMQIDKNFPALATACGLYLLGPAAKK